MTYRDQRLAKAERLRAWAAKRAIRSDRDFKSAHDAVAGIPLGQPILVGHHSERRHRAALARHDTKMHHAFENQETGLRMDRTADEIERQADQAIYRDDPDALEQLRARITELEAKRAKMKAENVAYRKGDAAYAAFRGITIEQAAALRVTVEAGYSWCRQPHPSYSLQNLGGNITRQRQRLAQIERERGPRNPDARPRLAGETATARAGLTVIAGMTTPSRPGKKPRPVWTVTGTVAYWTPVLLKLGGSAWQGAISFWEDPTGDLEHALIVQESPTSEDQDDTEQDEPEENPRERGDDDGVEYADPRDEIEDRLTRD